MKRLLVLLLCFTFNLQAGIYEETPKDYKVDHKQKHILEIAKSLPQVGVLKQKSNGYTYLDVSNAFITQIFPNLILDGHLRPTDSFGSEEGAHITVMEEGENNPGINPLLGKEFKFEVKDLRYVSSYKSIGPSKFHTGDRWMIGIESKELEELRMSLGLPPLVKGHDYHISIGFEVPFNRINNFGERPPCKY